MTDTSTTVQAPAWTLTDRLRKSLQVADMNAKDMAEVLGSHRNTVGNYLTGHTVPSRGVLIAWAL